MLAAFSFFSAAAPAAADCRLRPDESVLAETRGAQVTVKRATSDDPVWVACLKATGERRTLYRGHAGASGAELAARFRVAGTYVAFMVTDTVDHVQETFVRSLDLRTGRRRGSRSDSRRGSVEQLVLRRDGRTAWTLVDADSSSLYLREPGRGLRVDYARGPHAISAVRMTRTALLWNSAGQPRVRRLG